MPTKQTQSNRSLFFSLASFALLLCALSIQPVQADDKQPSGHKIHFSITESENVGNDRVSITFSHVAQGATPQSVTEQINKRMKSAFAVLKRYPDIVAQTSQYNIYPVYQKQLISHWRGQQSLTIHFENRPQEMTVLDEIQPHLAYKSMQFSVSDTRRKEVLEQLTRKAIQTYRQRAQLIASEFANAKYQLLETHINTPNIPVARALYARAETAMASDMSAPNVAAGESKIQIQISGRLLLKE